MKRTPLRAVSARRRRANAHRAAVLAHLRETQTWCSRCGVGTLELDVHELKSRAQGGSIIDIENICLVCRPCHNWITTHPKQAAGEGWAFSRKYAPDFDAAYKASIEDNLVAITEPEPDAA